VKVRLSSALSRSLVSIHEFAARLAGFWHKGAALSEASSTRISESEGTGATATGTSFSRNLARPRGRRLHSWEIWTGWNVGYVKSKRLPQMVMACDWPQHQVLIYVFGARKDEVFLQLSITRTVWHQTILYGWGSLPTVFEVQKHEVGKRKTTYWTETSGAENENQTTSSEDHLFFARWNWYDGNWTFINHYEFGLI